MGRRKVLLVGWDAADWRVIRPMLDAGELPNLSKLIEGGVMGNLATLRPPLSPMLWTSIATGKRPYKHGILGFSEPTPDGRGVRPVSGASRTCRAIWNILSEEGYRCHVVGWWPSHPAESIRGIMVSNHFAKATAKFGEPWPMMDGTVSPPHLAEALKEFRIHPQELGEEHILPFVPRAGEIDQDKDRRLETLAKMIAEATGVHGAATAIMGLEEWDFMAVYYDAIDHFSHAFMRYHPPKRSDVSDQDFELYQGVVRGAYRYHDAMLGALMTLAGEEASVIVMSDHGFHPDHLRLSTIPLEPAGPAAEHRHYGILVMKGEGLKRDEWVYGASVLDICPTILALFGLPGGQDMDGKVLAAAWQEGAKGLDQTIPTWERGEWRGAEERVIDPELERRLLRQWIDLGYLEEPDANSEVAVRNTVMEQRYNLARSYMDGGHFGRGGEILRQLYQEHPLEHRFGLQLAACYRGLGWLKELREVVENLLERRREEVEATREEFETLQKQAESFPGGRQAYWDSLGETRQREWHQIRLKANPNEFIFHYLLGYVAAEEGAVEEAVAHLKQAEAFQPGHLGLGLKWGEVWLKIGRTREARAAFEGVLRQDEESAAAQLGLARVALAERDYFQTSSWALGSVGLIHFNPYGHYILGVALARLGRLERAIQAMEVAVRQRPCFPMAHFRLARWYRKDTLKSALAEDHLRWARESLEELRRRKASREWGDPVLEEGGSPELEVTGVEWEPGLDWKGWVTVVTGLPRSGTSMMMRMLAHGGVEIVQDGVRDADENNPRGYYEAEAVKGLPQGVDLGLKEALGKAIKVVIPLVQHLPLGVPYRIILMERDLEEIVSSQARMLERLGKGKGAESLDHWKRVLGLQVRHALEQFRVRGWPVLRVQYRECVEDPGAITHRLKQFLGDRLDASAMEKAVDPRLYRERSGAEGKNRESE